MWVHNIIFACTACVTACVYYTHMLMYNNNMHAVCVWGGRGGGGGGAEA